MNQHKKEVTSGQRFEFGANWTHFLSEINEERIAMAEDSIRRMLGVQNLKDNNFLDIGSGSGLFSLAARRLGAKVLSFDYDPRSLSCTMELKRRYFPNDPNWRIEEGSILDKNYLATLGKFNIVYSWGVLHHTGEMWRALENVAPLASEGGKLFIAIYNDQGNASRVWLRIKKAYNFLPRSFRWIVLYPSFLRLWGPTIMRDSIRGRPLHTWRYYASQGARGMSPWRDVVDWVGGLPFEVAKPDEIFDFYQRSGFQLQKLITCAGGLGCNEYVFVKA